MIEELNNVLLEKERSTLVCLVSLNTTTGLGKSTVHLHFVVNFVVEIGYRGPNVYLNNQSVHIWSKI